MAGGKTKKVKKGSLKKVPSRNSKSYQAPQQQYPHYQPPPQYPQYQPLPQYPQYQPPPGYPAPAPTYPPPPTSYPPPVPGYQPNPPTPVYSPYPQYPYYPPQPYRQNSALPVIIAIVIIIIIIIATIVVAGILYSLSTYDEKLYDDEYYSSPIASALLSEKNTAFVITISSVNGGYLWLYDAVFEISDENDILQYKLNLDDSNPKSIYNGESVIYPMTRYKIPVTDGIGGALDGNDPIREYTNCTMAYIDQDGDEEVSVDDSIWIYKDNNNDGIDDVKSRYNFLLLDWNYDLVLRKTL